MPRLPTLLACLALLPAGASASEPPPEPSPPPPALDRRAEHPDGALYLPGGMGFIGPVADGPALAACGDRLERVELTATDPDWALEDFPPGAAPEIHAACADGSAPAFLVRGISSLHEGAIEPAAARGSPDRSRAGDHPWLRAAPQVEHGRLGGDAFQVRSSPPDRDLQGRRPVRLEVHGPGGAATLVSYPGVSPDAEWGLIWAGDLDGDGELDLVVDASSEHAGATLMLFLSSASSGEGPALVVALTRSFC